MSGAGGHLGRGHRHDDATDDGAGPDPYDTCLSVDHEHLCSSVATTGTSTDTDPVQRCTASRATRPG